MQVSILQWGNSQERAGRLAKCFCDKVMELIVFCAEELIAEHQLQAKEKREKKSYTLLD